MNDRERRNLEIIKEFRANAGVVGGMFEGTPLLLLTTTGAKSGIARTTPLAYLRDGDRVVVFAANGGRATHPGWYYNLLASAWVTVEIGSESYPATAVALTGAERARVWDLQVTANPSIADFAAATAREIPVVALTR